MAGKKFHALLIVMTLFAAMVFTGGCGGSGGSVQQGFQQQLQQDHPQQAWPASERSKAQDFPTGHL